MAARTSGKAGLNLSSLLRHYGELAPYPYEYISSSFVDRREVYHYRSLSSAVRAMVL